MIQYNLLRRRLERWSNFKIQVFIYCYQRGKFQQHLPHNLWGSDVARIFLFYFSKICNIFLTKVQQSYCYTNYKEEFLLKPISNIPNLLVCCNQVSLVFFTFKMDTFKIISSFSSLILHAVNFLFWKKIITVSKSITLRVFLIKGSGYPTKRGNRRGRGSPRKCKSLIFPLLLNKNITYWEIPHIEKKMYL